MHRNRHHRPATGAVTLLLAGILVWPAATLAQLGGQSPALPPLPLPTPTPPASAVAGQASAAQVTILGILGTAVTTTLTDTGNLAGTGDARDASQLAGNIPSFLDAEALQADTLGLAGEVDSEASLANLSLTVAGIPISADFIRASAVALAGQAGTASSEINNLAINGVPVVVTGAPNQTVSIPGGRLVINEQTISSTGSVVVNALHVTVYGIADVVIASATAGIS